MILIRIDWNLVAICFAGAVILYIIKFLITHFTNFGARANGGDRANSTILTDSSGKILSPEDPPPEFDNALKSSQPVSYVEIEESPPNYTEYLELVQSRSKLEDSALSIAVLSENDEVTKNNIINSNNNNVHNSMNKFPVCTTEV